MDPKRTLKLCGDAALRSFGATSLAGLRSAGVAAAGAAVMKGVVPHAVANIGPDVVCMGAARAAYKLMFGKGVAE